MKAFIALFAATVSFAALQAQAEETSCYGFRSQNQMRIALASKFSPEDAQQRVWCYRKTAAGTLIYNADSPELKPELAVFVDRAGVVTQASLLRGKTTIHKSKGSFSPIGVPLTPPKQGARPVTPVKDEKFKQSVEKTYQMLKNARTERPVFHARFMESEVEALDIELPAGTIRSKNIPFKGFWWSFAGGMLHAGPDAPLVKYDRYLAARGQVSLSAVWEAIRHAPDGNPWSGHCNGWAASSILRPEPTAPIHDPASGVTFGIGDQKGLLASQDNCVQAAFFGERYNGWSGETQEDIFPGDFHNTVLYYLGQLRKPIAMDRFKHASVDNHVSSGFHMDIKREGDHFVVDTMLIMHKYDAGPSEKPGHAPPYKKNFKYKIWVDGQGKVKKAQWLSDHPDFIWVPLGTTDDCDHANPYVTEQWIRDIMKYP